MTVGAGLARDALAAPPAGFDRAPVLAAYSGGLDSSVLLDLLARLPLQLQVVHVHHGLQAAADDWAAHCRRQCERRGLPLRVEYARIDPRDPRGPEAAAREARYAIFRALLPPGGTLVTAHHRDDQAETFLLRALRGSGTKGLGAMRPLQPFAQGRLWRPLLGFARAELAQYAQQQGLAWIDDPHNADPRYQRSWLRREVLPLLRQRWPAAAASLARSAELAAESDALLSELAAQDLARAADGAAVSVPAVQALSAARRRNLLRHWIAGMRGLPLPPHSLLLRVDAELLQARPDAEPCLAWPGGELRRYRERLFASAPLPPEPAVKAWDWDGRDTCVLPGCGRIEAGGAPPGPLRLSLPRGGERFRPAGSAHRRTLKNLFQESGVPPWRRRRTPLLYQGAELRWVAGLGAAEGAQAYFGALRWIGEGDG